MSPFVVFHHGPRPHIMTGRAVLRSCAKLLAACGIVGGLLAGQLGADPAEVAEAARSSKPKEIVVVGSKMDVSGDDGAQLTTEATATTAIVGYVKIDVGGDGHLLLPAIQSGRY